MSKTYSGTEFRTRIRAFLKCKFYNSKTESEHEPEKTGFRDPVTGKVLVSFQTVRNWLNGESAAEKKIDEVCRYAGTYLVFVDGDGRPTSERPVLHLRMFWSRTDRAELFRALRLGTAQTQSAMVATWVNDHVATARAYSFLEGDTFGESLPGTYEMRRRRMDLPKAKWESVPMVVLARSPISDSDREERHVFPTELVVHRPELGKKYNYQGFVFPVENLGVEWSFFQYSPDSLGRSRNATGKLDRIRVMTSKSRPNGIYKGYLVTMAEEEENYSPIVMEVQIRRIGNIENWAEVEAFLGMPIRNGK